MATIQVPNETLSQASRITKEGKKITYRLKVIQQPERARACGSGAKCKSLLHPSGGSRVNTIAASSDRRPVDPPPIVELLIYDGDQLVTHHYNANYFLFATLEHARTMAQGRLPSGQATLPVLTGTPVAGMAYLDRPHPAGYFIFPDLSVRHEGKYRLSFSLYEELKDQKDMDSEDVPCPSLANPTDAHVAHRLEVKSTPFTVFSAKKFPGLTESTNLSRMVAEQGCRVRIRRDVRMRRRPGDKSGKDWDEYEEETAYERARRTATPDTHYVAAHQPQEVVDRPRSGSVVSNASYHNMGSRRTSMENMNQSYQAPPPMSQPGPNGYGQQMSYSSSHGYQSQYPSQQTMMHPPQVPYSAQQQPQSQQYQQPQQPQQQPYAYPQQPYQQPYGENGHIRHNSMDGYQAPASNEFRRPAAPTHTQSYSSSSSNSYGADSYSQPRHSLTSHPTSPASSVPSHNSQTALAPLKNLPGPIPVDSRYETPAYDHSGPTSTPTDAYTQK